MVEVVKPQRTTEEEESCTDSSALALALLWQLGITDLSCASVRLAVVLQEIHRREERRRGRSGHAVGGVLRPQLRLELPPHQ